MLATYKLGVIDSKSLASLGDQFPRTRWSKSLIQLGPLPSFHNFGLLN